MQSKTIVLVGPMGVGKTTVGKKLASALNTEFRDTDSIFVSRHGSIAEFFALQGEERFREIERGIVDEALSLQGVLATGGGVVLDEHNREKMKSATVIYLSTDGTHMANRLSQGKRPLIANGLSDWKRIYDQRRSLYEQVADITLDCSGKPIKRTVEDIVEAVSK